MRTFLGIVVGIVIGFAAAALTGIAGQYLFPSNLRVERYTAEAAAELFPLMPLGAQLLSILSWSVAAFVGAVLAKRIGGGAGAAWTVAGFFTIYVALTLLVLPMPVWMQGLALIGPVLSGFIANRIVAGRSAAPTDSQASDDASL